MGVQDQQTENPSLVLYSYFRSSCSARVRIAAHIKGIKLQYRFINLLKGEQNSVDYVAINGGASVPTLIIENEGREVAKIQQSVAILEYLEEQFPDTTRLLPPASNVVGRAMVRQLVGVVACDIQPVTNLRILQQIEKYGQDRASWAKTCMESGLSAFEKIVVETAGEYCVANDLTFADVVLVPAVDGALRYGVDLAKFPTVQKIYTKLTAIEAFINGGWRSQDDTPPELRRS